MNHSKCADICNSLLRGELAAVETYQQAIDKFANEPGVAKLTSLLEEHRESVTFLRDNVARMGGDPASSSGAWGSFAQAVQGTAKLFGKESAVAALLQGEKKGRDDYMDALTNDDVLEECKELFRNQLIPRQERHISALQQLQNAL